MTNHLNDNLQFNLLTGIQELDELLSDFNQSNLLILAAYPNMGKSVFAFNIGKNVAKNYNKTVVIFDLKIPTKEVITHSTVNNKSSNFDQCSIGEPIEVEKEKGTTVHTVFRYTDISVNKYSDFSVKKIKDECCQLDNLGMVIIDDLQLLDHLNREKNSIETNRVKRISKISFDLKNMSKNLEVPVLCISQLPCAMDFRAERRPLLRDLREIGSIGQDADVVMFLYRESYYVTEAEKKETVQCIVAKNRYGRTGTVKLQ